MASVISIFSLYVPVWPAGILRVTVWNAMDLLPMDVQLDLKMLVVHLAMSYMLYSFHTLQQLPPAWPNGPLFPPNIIHAENCHAVFGKSSNIQNRRLYVSSKGSRRGDVVPSAMFLFMVSTCFYQYGHGFEMFRLSNWSNNNGTKVHHGLWVSSTTP